MYIIRVQQALIFAQFYLHIWWTRFFSVSKFQVIGAEFDSLCHLLCPYSEITSAL